MIVSARTKPMPTLVDKIEAVLLRRVFERRLDGYTLETAKEITDLVAAIYADKESKP